MRDGHPYEIEEMDELRAQQRRLLRSLPDEVVKPLTELDASKYMGRGPLELRVRELAETMAEDPTLIDLLTKVQRFQEAADLFNTLANGLAGQADGARLTSVITSVQTEYNAVRAEVGNLHPHDVPRSFSGLAALLCWADALAEDGYRDPRLESPPDFVIGSI
jgi:hypothetical protein